jgi:hypothetical protein
MDTCGILERQVVVESPETPASPDEIHGLRLPLAEMSKEVGYCFLWDTLHAPRLIAELRKTLRALDIQPFSSASVENYKRQTRKRLNRKATFVCLTGLSFLALAVFLLVNALRNYELVNDWRWLVGFAASFMAGGVMLYCSSEMRWKWQGVWLSDYRRPIPEFVLETACRISDHMPQARFWIGELVRGQEARDPFLVVQAGTSDTVRETYYVEVFEEPRFERVE